MYRNGTAVWCTTTTETGYRWSESKLCCWFQNHLLMFRGSRRAWFCSAVRVLTLSWKLKRIVPCKAHRGSMIVSVPSFLYQLALPTVLWSPVPEIKWRVNLGGKKCTKTGLLSCDRWENLTCNIKQLQDHVFIIETSYSTLEKSQSHLL